MAAIATFFNKFFSFFIILLVHLGCFIFTTTTTKQENNTDNHHLQPPSSKKRKISPSSPSHPKFKTHKALSSSWHFIKHLFCTKNNSPKNITTTTFSSPQSTTTTAMRTTNSSAAVTAAGNALTSARSSQTTLISLPQPDTSSPDPPRRKPPGSRPESDITAEDGNLFFPLRNDIFPCTACGEIFQKLLLLEQHQSTKHAVSELPGSDPGYNIVQLIFKSGWPETRNFGQITRILKIHNSQKILSRFEEYREAVKSRAARGTTRRRDERCVADGNELMRFHCSTFLCDLGLNGNSSICSQQFCNICGIIKSGFSPKLDGISTLASSWRAHVSIPEDIEQEFRFMNVKRAMLVCRVIAGRVGSDSDEAEKGEDGGGFDSVMASGGGGNSGVYTRLDEEELLVFNPRAVLPCFVIVYSA